MDIKNNNTLCWTLILMILLFIYAFIFFTDGNTYYFIFFNKIGEQFGVFFWSNITIFGDALVVLSLCGLLFFIQPKSLLAVFIGGILSAIIISTLKYYFYEHLRPLAVLDSVFHIDNSPIYRTFPSGHTGAIFVYSSIFFYYLWNFKIPIIFVFLLAILVGISRMALGIHWPFDIIVGAIIGWVSSGLGIYITNIIGNISNTIYNILGSFIVLCSLFLLFFNTGYKEAIILQYTIATIMILLSCYKIITINISNR